MADLLIMFGCSLQMARLEKSGLQLEKIRDCPIFFKFFLCILEEPLRVDYGLFFPREKKAPRKNSIRVGGYHIPRKISK